MDKPIRRFFADFGQGAMQLSPPLWKAFALWGFVAAVAAFGLTAAATGEVDSSVLARVLLGILGGIAVMFMTLAPWLAADTRANRSETQLEALNEVASWAEAQRQNFQQYVHVHAEGYTKRSSETLFSLRVCNALYDKLSIDNSEGDFIVSEVNEVTASLPARQSINRGESSTVTLVARDPAIEGKIEFRGSMDVTVFGESRKLEYKSPGLSPIWDVGKGGR